MGVETSTKKTEPLVQSNRIIAKGKRRGKALVRRCHCKDGLITLTENFLINMDELSTMSRYEVNTLKSMFSKDRIKVRLPFEKRATSLPRIASFIGSTNKTQFLNDETGSVRFINFEVDRIDWSYAKDMDINIAWSQAYQLWKTNFTYDLSSAEIQENEQVNNEY